MEDSMSQANDAAIVAIFHRQLGFDRAVRFVVKQAGVSEAQAEQALRGAMTWYRA
jgi:hypothetical protein